MDTDALIIDYIQRNHRLPQDRQDKALEKLHRYSDVYEEFVAFIKSSAYIEGEAAVTVQGCTAKQIAAATDLTPLGVFNYLIYLREKPEEALENLRKGLPIKDSRPSIEDSPDGGASSGESEAKPTDEKPEVGDASPAEPTDNSRSSNPKEPEEQLSGNGIAVLEGKLADALKALAALQEAFDDKIAEDQHKNRLFDNMHRELTSYQNGLLDKTINTMALDIIQLVDSVKKNIKAYEEREPNEENYGKLLKSVRGIAEDLDDVLYRQSIEPYTVPGDDVDVRRQKIIQNVDTDDQTKDNKIAERVKTGYEKDGKPMRQEIIKIFKFKPDNTNN